MRENRQGHQGVVIWLTGLPAAGKSTIAKSLEHILFERGYNVARVDADNLRRGLCSDLGFSVADRAENVRRLAHAARLLLDAGNIVLVACIAPFRIDRENARQIIGVPDFQEVYVDCPVNICIQRDPKGLYAKAVTGEIAEFTGVSSAYEVPCAPAATINTSILNEIESTAILLNHIGKILGKRSLSK